MNFVIPSFTPAIPEIVLLTLTSLLLVADTIWSKRSEFATYYATQLILLVVGYLVWTSFSVEQVLTFDGSFVRDAFGDVLKLFIVIISMGIFLFS
jgi:NADH-quinone oxidoreductase subunit N